MWGFIVFFIAFIVGLVCFFYPWFKKTLPTTMTVGGHTYDILSFLQGGERSVKGDVMVKRAKELQANLGKEEREHILNHQDEIPAVFRGKVIFVFTDDRRTALPGDVCYIYWYGDHWVTVWTWLDFDWDGHCRVLRRNS